MNFSENWPTYLGFFLLGIPVGAFFEDWIIWYKSKKGRKDTK